MVSFLSTCLAAAAAASALFLPLVSADGHYKIDMELVVGGLEAPLDLTFAPGDDETRYVVEQSGVVFVLRPDNTLQDTPFLDISDRVELSDAFDERGLLGFTFHPQYTSGDDKKNVYLHYSTVRQTGDNICKTRDNLTPQDGDGCPFQHHKVISEMKVVDGVVDPSTERVLLDWEWPGRKHVGGGLEFGPDGYLYMGIGDGGNVHGPEGSDQALTDISPALYEYDLVAQDLTNLWGKVLRIDVDTLGDNGKYGIPPTNPFVTRDEYPSEIYAWGFRNPYRISFDANGSGDLYIGATGETLYEATYRISGPSNCGWAAKEGSHCISRAQPLRPPETVTCVTDADCPIYPNSVDELSCGSDGYCTCPSVDAEGYTMVDPLIEYINSNVMQFDETMALIDQGFLNPPQGRASLGGSIYRGQEIPWLQGKFVQGDFAESFLDGLVHIATDEGSIPWTLVNAYKFDDADDSPKRGFVKSIGQDAKGELYAVTGDFTPTGVLGAIYKIVDATEPEATEEPTSAPVEDTTEAPTEAPVDQPTTTSAAFSRASFVSLAMGMMLVVGAWM